MSESSPVLILGAGINGAALARELALNGVPVVIVDAKDACFGATAYSSRLIHGGLRYLEYGDFALVRESLAERARLLKLAPQFVHPLHIHIPVAHRWGGWLTGARRFLGLGSGKTSERGLELIETGLWLYDRFARDPSLPRRSVRRVGREAGPQVDPTRFRWLCGYWDAQIRFPERYVQALLADARQLAHEAGVPFRLVTYHRVQQQGNRVELVPESNSGEVTDSFEVAAIINATGAWVDLTLQELGVASPRLMGGTKGSHFITFHDGLRGALGDQALYAEAEDGRPIFILPFGDSVLVGTTDIPFSGRPEDALASDAELDYLIAAVNEFMPQVGLTRADLELHYCGVRPLPSSDAATPASVTRRHKLVDHGHQPVPMFSLVGGKLTTSRQLAEEAAALVLGSLGRTSERDSRSRFVPGGMDYPGSPDQLLTVQCELAAEFLLSSQQVAAAWLLFGTRLRQVLVESSRGEPSRNIPWQSVSGTNLPTLVVRWIIEHEGPRTLDDLVERRLMLLYHRPLTRACLRELAELMADCGVMAPDHVSEQVTATTQRLRTHFGKSAGEV